MTEQMNVPKLRFGEFDQEWTSGSLATICNKIQDGNYGAEYPKSDELLELGIPFLTSKALGGSGIINVSKIDYISKAKHASLKKAQLQLDDVLFTNRGSNVGVISYVDERIAHGNIGPQLTLLRANDLVTPKFLKAYLQTRLFQKQVASQDSGSAMNFFGIKTTSKFKVSVPQITEQQKIASFLSKVDEKIGLLSEKKDKLTEYKRGVMQQLFNGKWQSSAAHCNSQDGQLTFTPPTLRFKADDGSDFPDWEEKTLSDFSKIYDGTHQTPKYVEEGVPFYSVEHVTANQFHKTKFISEEVFVKECKRVTLKKGDILMTRIGSVGDVKLIDWDVKASFYVSLALVKYNEKVTGQYLASYMQSPFFQSELWKRMIHVAFPKKINLGEIGNCLVSIPSTEEQVKIADFLSTIDQKIDLANSELNKAKEWKKGLLQQMFV